MADEDIARLGIAVDSSSAKGASVDLDSLAAAAKGADASVAGLSATTVSGAGANSVFAKALAAAGGDLSKVSLAALGLATAQETVGTSAIAASAQLAVLGETTNVVAASQAHAAELSAGVTREFMVLGREAISGNFSRIPGSLIVLSNRLATTGTSVLTLKNAMSVLGGIGEAVFNPFVIGTLAVGLALDGAIKLFHYISGSDGEAAAEALKQHKNLINEITKAYPLAAAAAKAYEDQAALISQPKALDQAATDIKATTAAYNAAVSQLRGALQAELASRGAGLGTTTDANGSIIDIKPTLNAVDQLVQAFNPLKDQAKDLDDALIKIKLDPSMPADLRDEAAAMEVFVEKAMAAQIAVNTTTMAVKGLIDELNLEFTAAAKGNPDADPNGNNAKFAADQLAKMAQSKAEFQARLATINAQTPDQKRAAAEQAKAVELSNQDMSTELRNQEILQAGELAYASAIKKTTKALDDKDKKFQQLKDTEEASTDKIRDQIKALGLDVYQTTLLEQTTELLNKAKKEGLALSPTQISQLKQEAEANAEAAQQLDYLTQAYDTGKSSFTDFFSTLKDNLAQGQDLWSAFSGAAVKAIDDILDAAVQAAASAAFNSIWNPGGTAASSGGGLGGLVSSIIGSFMPHNAAGTNNWSGGMTWVGENGPELVSLPKGSQVIPNNKAGNAQFGHSFVFAPNYNVQGASASDIADLKAQAAAMHAGFERRVLQTLRDPHSRMAAG